MFNKRFYYLIKIQYLGYRFHGWQKQPNLKTVHLMIDKTLNFIFEGEIEFKTLGSGRTDAMVSANEMAFQLFTHEAILDFDGFISKFNYYLPQDIKALSIEEVNEDFNIIQNAKVKEYHYVFAFGQKAHPFCASILTTFRDHLDIQLMKEGARLFEGTHNFKAFCSNVSEQGLYRRTILQCEIVENDIYSANFFPNKTYILKVKGEGFGYNQIRLMVGALVQLSKGETTIDFIKENLKEDSKIQMDYIAPASGLILHSIAFS